MKYVFLGDLQHEHGANHLTARSSVFPAWRGRPGENALLSPSGSVQNNYTWLSSASLHISPIGSPLFYLCLCRLVSCKEQRAEFPS